MSASPVYRQMLSSQPNMSVPNPHPKIPSVLKMSDVHIVQPKLDGAPENARKAQMIRALHRIFAKSPQPQNTAHQNWNVAGPAPSAAVNDYTAGSQQMQPLPRAATNTYAPPPLPTHSGPRIGVIKTSEVVRSRTPQACERCRARKTKCCGTRPSCKRCFNRGVDCVYVLNHKANRAQLKKLKEASGFFPIGRRPANGEGQVPRQRKPSPSRFDPFLKMMSGIMSPNPGLSNAGSSRMAAPAPQDNAFDHLDAAPINSRQATSPLATMSWTVPDTETFSQPQPQARAPMQPSSSALDSSYSFMEMDSELNAAIAYMSANESLPHQQAPIWQPSTSTLPPMTLPTLSNESTASSSSSNYTPLPTPLEKGDVLMLDMFGPDALAASASGAELELPCSDSELERELEACMAEMLGSTSSSKTVRFCLDPARPVRPLPARPVPAGAVPPPVIALEGRSFPLESSNGVFFDEQMYEAFRTASYPAFPLEESAGKDMTFDEIFGLGSDGMEEVMRAHAAGDQLQTIMEDPAETDVHGELEATTDPRAGLWDELFGDGQMEALGIQIEA